MNLKQVKALKRGDRVFWNDPDNGECSRIYKIHTIRVVNPKMVRILENGASELECPPEELAPVKKYAVKVYWEMSAEHEVWATNKSHAVQTAMEAPLPPSNEWTFTPDSENVDKELDVQEIQGVR